MIDITNPPPAINNEWSLSPPQTQFRMILQVLLLLLFTQTTLTYKNEVANTVWTKFKNSSSENLSDRKDLIINGITGKITNHDWRKQVNQLTWPLNSWQSGAPTNVVKCKLFCKTGYHLQIRRNGVVSGSLNQKSKYSKYIMISYLELWSITSNTDTILYIFS